MFHCRSISKNITESHVCLPQSLFLADRSTLADDSQITALATEIKGKWKCIGVKGKVLRFQPFQIFVCSPTPPIYQLFLKEVDGIFCEKCQFAVFTRDNAGKIDSLNCVLWTTQKTQNCKTPFSGKQFKEAHWTHIAKSMSMECCPLSIFHNQVLWNWKLQIIGCQLTQCLHTIGSAAKPRGIQCLRSYQLDLQLDHVGPVC